MLVLISREGEGGGLRSGQKNGFPLQPWGDTDPGTLEWAAAATPPLCRPPLEERPLDVSSENRDLSDQEVRPPWLRGG